MDVLGSTEGCGLTEGDWDNVGGELGMLDGFGDGITEVLGEALIDGIGDGCIDSEGKEVGANSGGRQAPPSNPHSYELYGRKSPQFPSLIHPGFDTKQSGYPSTGEGRRTQSPPSYLHASELYGR